MVARVRVHLACLKEEGQIPFPRRATIKVAPTDGEAYWSLLDKVEGE